MHKHILTTGCIATLLAASPALAQESPYLKPDGTWISLSGTVAETMDESFILDYGRGAITVEMDDWAWYDEHGDILENDRVTVYGIVDDDTFETATIDANSVYVENLGTYFYASPADEDSYQDIDPTPAVPIVPGDITVTGTITSIEGREFTIDSGLQQITVETIELPYNPLDDRGFQQLDLGDTVTVTGNMESDIFDRMELVAESIVTLDEQPAGGS
ncbi:NirD/YgiW/YdeI family stress tolerance protein [Marinobacter sp.]|uniref:NirD/YgiW/YdeI family stress tolerance protein n=1 Tax=Marinobacter sp. TaxID=50741 RepID=UPI00385053D5